VGGHRGEVGLLKGPLLPTPLSLRWEIAYICQGPNKRDEGFCKYLITSHLLLNNKTNNMKKSTKHGSAAAFYICCVMIQSMFVEKHWSIGLLVAVTAWMAMHHSLMMERCKDQEKIILDNDLYERTEA
jgi:hypothetical protein